jgi:hypothetical protein
MLKSLIMIAAVFLALMSTTNSAFSRQIRIDANTCKVITPELKRKLANRNYPKAVAAKKAGRANPAQLERLYDVSFLRSALRFAKCRKIP